MLTVGSKEVTGRNGLGCGFRIEGTAKFIPSGAEFDMMKSKFSFLTRVLEVSVTLIKQTL